MMYLHMQLVPMSCYISLGDAHSKKKKNVFHFLIRLFYFLQLSFKSSLYSLDNSPLLDVSFSNTFPQYVGCLYSPLTMSFAEKWNTLLFNH